MSLHSAMNREKRGLLCKDYWQSLSAKPTANHGDLSAIRRRFSFFVPSSWVLCAYFAAIAYRLKISAFAQITHKQLKHLDFHPIAQPSFRRSLGDHFITASHFLYFIAHAKHLFCQFRKNVYLCRLKHAFKGY